ncbi:MAG TPA: undecaprenyl-diphosphate phosphatase [Candidatus Paceibacterota bacterium]|jgi:undecaprenyl-diphosphatase|nr:undecaprenyl-diphosphate phosphatase [Candidatus Paceibacterota bacterium]
MLTYAQAVILGLLQGVAELFPISSLGHSVLLPQLLNWQLDQTSPQFLAFIVATHLGTALVLLGFFWRDWVRIIAGIFRSLYMREIRNDDTYAKLGWLLVAGTIPAGLLGILLQQQLQTLFGAGALVAAALFGNGIVLFLAEKLRKRAPAGVAHDEALAGLSFGQAIGIGAAQAIALIPGFSRTGASIAGGLLSGLSHENAARFAFLLATPIIFAAAVLNAPEVLSGGSAFLGVAFVGVLCAAAAAYVSVRFLTRYFKTNTLTPFAIYCVAAGLISLLFLAR